MIFMCSTYVPLDVTPSGESLSPKETSMFWCRSCKKTFILKSANPECPHCGSKEIKPRMP